jgi:hypothetical protein
MRNVLILLMVGVLCTGASLASYSYTVSGKVYYSGTTLPVSNAAVSHEVEYVSGSGVWTLANTISANDGSYSFSFNSTIDPKNKNMRLKVSKNIFAGGKTWVSASYSETWDLWLQTTLVINPNLHIGMGPSNFAHAGTQLPVTTVAFLDQPTTSVEVYEFRTVVSYDSAKMSCSIAPAPDSFFDVFLESSGPGTITVHGMSRIGPIPLMAGVPQSFFDVYFTVPVVDPPSYAEATIEAATELYTTSGIQQPYPYQTQFLLGEPEKCKAAFLIKEYSDWEKALQSERPYANIRPMSMTHWQQYMDYWHSPETEKQGLMYPETTFVPCADLDGIGDPDGMLYAWPEGGGSGGALGPGLVMTWKFGETSGNYASAWRYDYGLDPDLRNCTIQVTVTPPAPPPGVASQINAVSFSIVDITGKLRTWWWSVPAAIPLGVSTTVKINTAIAGIGAATPAATGYLNVPGFNLAQSQFFDVDENFQYIFQQFPVPPPGQQQFVWAWNYWHNLIVTQNTTSHKWFYIKYSQKPEVIGDSQPPMIHGWDEKSMYANGPIMADDWECTDDRPITDIHWWGSFIGWTQPTLPPVLPKAFHIGIWTDVAKNDPANQFPYSHPGKLIWENTCTSWVWNFAGYDMDPRIEPMKDESCFQFTQLLSEDEWFHQDPNDNVYWLSIAAVYDPTVQVQYPWGWKTRPHFFNDDAVRIQHTSIWPPTIGSVFNAGIPVQLPEWPDPIGISWDLAFELSTNEPKAPASADLNYDGIVNLADFAIFASKWLTAG